MMKGLLRVSGKIDLSQFWPSGGSDADTASVMVTATSFEFSTDGSTKGLRRTRVFEGADIRGKKVIKTNGTVTIRLQGIDAPELHFPPILRGSGLKGNNKSYRQFQGETATARLRQILAKGKPAIVSCVATTRINVPNDAFDSNGRLIADINVGAGAKQVSIAHWLAKNGWALPTYYNSMLPAEIKRLQQLCNAARNKGLGIWPHLINVIGPAPLLTFRKGGPFNTANELADRGPFVMPKMFRRRIRYDVLALNNLAPATFKAYLGGAKTKDGKNTAKKDNWTTVQAFLKNPNMKRPTNSLAAAISASNVFSKGPGDIVLFEDPTTLKKNGTPIRRWKFV
jgi:endonuclease YncB( thermonuclease family)